MLFKKIANRRGIDSRTLDYLDKFPSSSLYWEPTLARDSTYVTVQSAAIRELKLCFKKSYKMYYYLSLARFFWSWDSKECIVEATGLWNLYVCICWFCMLHWIFLPSRVIFSTWKRRSITTSTFLRSEKIKNDLTPNLINPVHCLLDFFKLKIQRSDTLGRCFLNAVEFVYFQSYILI